MKRAVAALGASLLVIACAFTALFVKVTMDIPTFTTQLYAKGDPYPEAEPPCDHGPICDFLVRGSDGRPVRVLGPCIYASMRAGLRRPLVTPTPGMP